MSLANKLSDRFAGIALVCSNMFNPIEKYYKDDKKLPFLIIAGTKDPLLPFDGGLVTLKYKSVGYASTINYWVNRNNCNFPKDSIMIDNDPKDKTEVIKYYSQDESSKTPVIGYKINGGGHAWPERGKDFKSIVFGKISNEINASEIISNFFLNLDKPDTSLVSKKLN